MQREGLPTFSFFLFPLKVSLPSAGVPPEIVQSIHALKNYEKSTKNIVEQEK